MDFLPFLWGFDSFLLWWKISGFLPFFMRGFNLFFWGSLGVIF